MPVVKGVRNSVHKPFPAFFKLLVCGRCRPQGTADLAADNPTAGKCARCGVEVSTSDGTGAVVWMRTFAALEFMAGH